MAERSCCAWTSDVPGHRRAMAPYSVPPRLVRAGSTASGAPDATDAYATVEAASGRPRSAPGEYRDA